MMGGGGGGGGQGHCVEVDMERNCEHGEGM